MVRSGANLPITPFTCSVNSQQTLVDSQTVIMWVKMPIIKLRKVFLHAAGSGMFGGEN